MSYLLRGACLAGAVCLILIGYSLLAQAWRGHPEDGGYSRGVRFVASLMAVLFGMAFASSGLALVMWMVDHA